MLKPVLSAFKLHWPDGLRACRVGPWLRVPGSGICATAGIRSECSFESLRDFVETLDKPDTIIPNLTTEA